MDYSPTLCFIGFNSKMRISARKKRKIAIAAVSVATEFCVSQQTSKQMAKEISHDNISSVTTKRTEYRRGAMSRQKTACRDKSAGTKKVNVATRFVSWMSTLGKTCLNIKAPVATLETGRKQKFCCDKVSYVATLIIATWKSLLRQKEYAEEIPLSQQENLCCDTL